jgi:hypothetical protein
MAIARRRDIYDLKARDRVPSQNERLGIYNKYIYDKLTTKDIAIYYNLVLARVNTVLFTTNPNKAKPEVVSIIGFYPKTAYNEPIRQFDRSYLSVEEQLLSSPFYNPKTLKNDERKIYKAGNISEADKIPKLSKGFIDKRLSNNGIPARGASLCIRQSNFESL